MFGSGGSFRVFAFRGAFASFVLFGFGGFGFAGFVAFYSNRPALRHRPSLLQSTPIIEKMPLLCEGAGD